MTTFGKTLRQAREAKGYTTQQLASETNLLKSIVEELEAEDFSHIPAPIYGRGFVKLYCEAVGIDPKPMVAEFMSIVNGETLVDIKEMPVTAPEKSEPIPEPPPATEAESPLQSVPSAESDPLASFVGNTSAAPCEPQPPVQDDFFLGPGVAANPSPARQTVPPQAPATLPTPHEEIDAAGGEPHVNRRTISRYVAPLRERKMPSIPPAFWRLSLLSALALGMLLLIGLGISALHSAVTGKPSAEIGVVSAASQEPDTPVQSSAAPAQTQRTPQKIPSLYLD